MSEASTDSRFYVDEHNMVTDSYAMFVLHCFTTSEGLMDPRLSFYANRVFKDYLFPKEILEHHPYIPLCIDQLMRAYDTSSYRGLERGWMARYPHLRFTVSLSRQHTEHTLFEGSAFFVVDEQPLNNIRSEIVNDSMTLTALTALAHLANKVATNLRTYQYKRALQK